MSRNLGFNAMLGKNRVVQGSGNYCRQGNLLCLGLAYPEVSRDLAASRCFSGTRRTALLSSSDRSRLAALNVMLTPGPVP